MKNKFLQISLGISLVLFSLGFLLRSIETAQATPKPENFISQGTNVIGKYTMAFQIYTYTSSHTNGVLIDRRVIIMNTETGKTVYYGLSDADSNWKKMEAQLPASPFGE